METSRAPRFLLAAVLASLPPLGVIALEWRFGIAFETPLDLAVMVGGISYPLWLARLKIDRTGHFVSFLVGFSTALGVASYLTGAANGLTDESYTTPLYASLILHAHNLYSVPLTVTYIQYGVRSTVSTFYSYLPLLTFLQVPYLSYKLLSAACWLGIVWLVRRDFYSAVILAQPYVGILAFNGFNDFVPLLLLTAAFVGWAGKRQWWAQAIALGTKQFANVFVFAYHLLRRDWRNAGLTALITLAFLVPFLVWDWRATLCQAVLYGLPAGCQGAGHLLLFHIDYGLWPLWCAGLFYAPVLAFLRSDPARAFRSRLRGTWDRWIKGPP